MAIKGEEEHRDAAHWADVEEATELLHEERYAEALVELRAALQRDAKNPYAYYFLGVAFFESGEAEAARDAYAASAKIAPRYLGARVALCHTLRMTGDIRGAIREGMAALSLSPGDPDSLHAVGLAYQARGDNLAARKYLEAFLATGPELEVSLEVQALLATLEGAPKPPEGDDD